MQASDRILSKRYARSYLDLDGKTFSRQEEAAAEKAIADLLAVRNAASPYRRFLLHPLIGYSDKNEILALLLPKELMLSRAASFVRLLLRENRFYLLETVVADCGKLFNSFAGILPALATTRLPLDEADAKRAAAVLSSATGKKVKLSNVVSEGVVGGLEIKIGDLVIDATVKGRLERLKRRVQSE